jgi:hypothetical protein
MARISPSRSINWNLIHSFGVHYDIFAVPEEPDSIASGTKGQFYTSWNGDIDRLSLPLVPTLPEGILFTRAPEKISKEMLLNLVGDYSLGNDTAHVCLAGDTLQLTIPEEPSYDLVPTRGISLQSQGPERL